MFIIETTYYDQKLYSATAQCIEGIKWHKGFSPDEHLSTWHDKEQPHYIKWLKEKNTPPKTEMKTSVTWEWDTREKRKMNRGGKLLCMISCRFSTLFN